LVKAVNLKKLFSSFILLFLALSLCCSLQFVCLVSANFLPTPVPAHSIEITEDGDVTGTDKIQRSSNLYTFTGDIVGSIVIFRSGVVVDGAGYTLQGNGDRTGIWLQAENNVEIKNLHIRNFNHGIEFTYGMSMDGCTDVTLSGNTITDNEYGITFWIFSGSNYLLGNTIANNTYGIHIGHSPNNVFRNNQLTNNKYNFWVSSETSVQMTHYINDIDASNTIDGKPIVYWVNEQDKTVPSDAGYVALVNCTNITVQSLTLTNNSQGILLVATNNSLITKNHITNNNYGIVLFAPYEQCTGNIITENNITANTKDGINSWNSENTNITGNSITNNLENGIIFYDSRGATISGNTITANKENGIKLWGYDSSDNTVSGNHIENNENGITLDTAFNNKITGNNITSNRGWGIILNYNGFPPFSNNTIYHNDFVNNKQAIYTVDELLPPLPDMDPAIDRWDNGLEGNYWSNYNGTDNDGDGIGDTPYIINENNQDNNPLMNPLDIKVIPEFPSWTPLLILLVAVVAVAVVYRRRLSKNLGGADR
jgi:parallel beta-helix repeat protein